MSRLDRKIFLTDFPSFGLRRAPDESSMRLEKVLGSVERRAKTRPPTQVFELVAVGCEPSYRGGAQGTRAADAATAEKPAGCRQSDDASLRRP